MVGNNSEGSIPTNYLSVFIAGCFAIITEFVAVYSSEIRDFFSSCKQWGRLDGSLKNINTIYDSMESDLIDSNDSMCIPLLIADA